MKTTEVYGRNFQISEDCEGELTAFWCFSCQNRWAVQYLSFLVRKPSKFRNECLLHPPIFEGVATLLGLYSLSISFQWLLGWQQTILLTLLQMIGKFPSPHNFRSLSCPIWTPLMLQGPFPGLFTNCPASCLMQAGKKTYLAIFS